MDGYAYIDGCSSGATVTVVVSVAAIFTITATSMTTVSVPILATGHHPILYATGHHPILYATGHHRILYATGHHPSCICSEGWDSVYGHSYSCGLGQGCM